MTEYMNMYCMYNDKVCFSFWYICVYSHLQIMLIREVEPVNVNQIPGRGEVGFSIWCLVPGELYQSLMDVNAQSPDQESEVGRWRPHFLG